MQILAKFPHAHRMKPDNNPINILDLNGVTVSVNILTSKTAAAPCPLRFVLQNDGEVLKINRKMDLQNVHVVCCLTT